MTFAERLTLIFACVLLSFLSETASAKRLASNKQHTKENVRLVVLTDMGADPDDEQSLVRLLLYSNRIDIKGIVATTSCWQQNTIRPDFIENILSAYERVQSKLLKHEAGFPTAADLRGVAKKGIARYGMQGVGDGMDSEGSELIIRELESDDDRPLWISVWGGPNVLAQALFKLEQTKAKEELQRLVSKLRIYTISDQDDSAIWLRKTFPDLFYIVSPGDDYGPATWLGIKNTYDGINNENVSNHWIATNIQQGHGALGAVYPDVSWGMEGDTPAFLGLIPNGLNSPEHPNWGGWGGRYELSTPDFEGVKDGSSIVIPEPETRPIWTNATDTYFPFLKSEFDRPIKRSEKSFISNQVTLWRWRSDFQNDFAARMDWCIKDHGEANHAPVIKLNHSDSLTVKSGQGINFDAFGTKDPDGDSISFLWFHYPEAGTWKKPITANGAENFDRFRATAPEVDKNETAHFILKVTDKGSPPLCSYKRLIVTIER